MRVLVTIPHFFRRAHRAEGGEPGFYGSESGDAEARRQQVEQCLAALAQTFGPRQALMSDTDSPAANAGLAVQMDVVLVTTRDQHLVDLLPIHLYLHCATEAEPRCLGFVCHELMREHAAAYDWFVYLEDDIEITDPLFFTKLAWFVQRFGPAALLQPNRYERCAVTQVMKLYVDGNTTRPELSATFQDVTQRPLLEAEVLGRVFRFKRVGNVHSGCFCVSAAQLRRMLDHPRFGKPNAEFFGPLESAATLVPMQAFEVYKPALDNAGFLEVNHVGRRFLIPATAPATTPAAA